MTTSPIMLYADDTVIFDSANTFDTAHDRLQTSLDNFAMWCLQNKLTVNVKKTKLMIFTASKRKLNSLNVNLTLNNEKLMVVPSYKYLGVVLDSHLKYDSPCKESTKKL